MLKFKQGFYADVRIEDRSTTTILYRNGALEECKNTNVKKAFLRVFDGQMWYYTSTYKLNALQEELDALYANATENPDIENHPIVKKFQVNKDKQINFANKCVKDVALAKKQALVTDNFAYVKSDYVKMIMGYYMDRYSKYSFVSSKGADIEYDVQYCGTVLSLSFANETETFDNAIQKSGIAFGDLAVSPEEIEKLIKESEEYMLNAQPVTPGVYPVILAPIVAGVFAHESFGHKSEADFMLGDEGMRKEWAIGKKVGSDILSIYDSGIDYGSGYVPYDDEGTKATKTYLIKDGKLAGRLHSATTATYLDEEVTGNARAMNTSFEPIVRMTNTVIEGGEKTTEELFAGVKHGYYIKDLKHGSGMSTFTIAPSMCYEIVDGKIGKPVKIAVITGNVFETLNLIDGLSQKAELFSFVTGGCGKMEQHPLNVGFGGPYVSISKMNVQ